LGETNKTLRVGLAGSLGRMGRAVAGVLAERSDAAIVAAFDQPGAAGQALGALKLTTLDVALPQCDVVIDFSSAEASAALAKTAAAAGRPALVIGSTGWSEAQELELWAAAKQVAIVRAGNFSLGVNVLAGLVE
jgi:4-hydroxy-tetrahydrodipicolinate reductase